MPHTVTISIRLTPHQHQLLRSAAARLGWSPTCLARRAIIAATVRIETSPDSDLGEIMTPMIVNDVETSK
jgi:hypothetical protein